MDDVSSSVAGIGAMADDTLDMYVSSQVACPLNFKDLTEVLLTKRGAPVLDFFLASIAATAIIRLAAVVVAVEEQE